MSRHTTVPKSILWNKVISLSQQKQHLERVLEGSLVVTGQEPKTRERLARIREDITEYIEDLTDNAIYK